MSGGFMIGSLIPQPVLLGFGVLMILTGVAGLRSCALRERLLTRLERLRAGTAPSAAPETERRSLLSRIGAALARTPLVGSADRERMRKSLIAAGYNQPGHLTSLLGIKLLCIGAGMALVPAAAGDLLPSLIGAAAQVVAGALLGWRLPDLALGRMRDRRLEEVRNGLPDALDLLVICGEAGLGLEAAVDRVAREVATAYPALSAELSATAAEMRVLSDRGGALNNLAARLDMEGVRGMATTLIQAMRYGTPLAQALRVLAGEMRAQRLARFEEKAARLPVLLTLPMVVFILPCVFIVVGGPAMLDVSRSFDSAGTSQQTHSNPPHSQTKGGQP
ncbi:type II secretion system F family protein [Azospirillum sp. Vi22]|uniref:type II secretion system F family protein n=1 Tax=Azospirillum baldaniorum TaxID=1064539 RepID=UPI00157B5094|nr:type II secretion system F family protein [Azospirillum baldaniorum]NUB10818.1 type II secretion system F family protein [Azospirillum baldaniorum]